MKLHLKRKALSNAKFAFNKLTHHLFALKVRIDTLSEEVRQDELALHIATSPDAITYIPEGKSTRKTNLILPNKRKPVSSTIAKKYLDYANTLSNGSKRELQITLRTQLNMSAQPRFCEE